MPKRDFQRLANHPAAHRRNVGARPIDRTERRLKRTPRGLQKFVLTGPIANKAKPTRPDRMLTGQRVAGLTFRPRTMQVHHETRDPA